MPHPSPTQPPNRTFPTCRAKRHLYIIGDHDNWKHLRYFNFLATTILADRR
ncbi:hypothetical protein ACIQUM_35645 [Amycolatopsis azurea]|uniref:hypothetical protein n=1 Tax=Amycolatopsis azurea TaxID=36819 RepID=UPI00382054CC